MTTLYIANTYYQLIVACQLALTRDGAYDLWLSDHSLGSEVVVERLRACGPFREVRYIRTKRRWYGDRRRCGLWDPDWFMSRLATKPLTATARREIAAEVPYDEVVFYNLHSDIRVVVDSSRALGSTPRLMRMEEGLVTCGSTHGHCWSARDKAVDTARALIGRVPVSRSVEGFYCFVPELCDKDFPLRPVRIPGLSETRGELAPLLREAFGYEGFPYEQRHVFFASSMDVDGTPTGETGVVLRLAEGLGPEDLLVKMHPRDGRDVYQGAGIPVMEQSSVPWEVVQLCEDLSDRVLLTCTSGAPLAVTALLDDGTRARYVVPEAQGEAERANYERAMEPVLPMIERLHELGLCGEIRVSPLADVLAELG